MSWKEYYVQGRGYTMEVGEAPGPGLCKVLLCAASTRQRSRERKRETEGSHFESLWVVQFLLLTQTMRVQFFHLFQLYFLSIYSVVGNMLGLEVTKTNDTIAKIHTFVTSQGLI